MYELIEHKKLDAAAASITFSNIPQIYTDLVILVSARRDRSDTTGAIGMQFNGDTGSNYSARTLYGTGSATGSFASVYLYSGETGNATDTANTFHSTSIYIPNYRSSVAKSVSVDAVSENNATTAFQTITAALWTGIVSIQAIAVFPQGGNNFVQHSSATLYGINRTQALGAPKAIGGNITYANGYWVHTFTGSGTFYAQEDLEVDALVVAGGGGGGYRLGGGGGAGGYLYQSGLNVSAQESCTVLVGAGGSAGINTSVSGARGFQGGSSAFTSVAATGGGGGGSLPDVSTRPGGSGGSGGGASFLTTVGSGIPGQGFNGGNGNDFGGANGGGGGGGGASEIGTNYTSNTGGRGGNGIASAITGTSVFRAGGGGGGTAQFASSGGVGGGGGLGGGGASGGREYFASPGTANTGGGGGGGGEDTFLGLGHGGSGVVIVRYKAD